MRSGRARLEDSTGAGRGVLELHGKAAKLSEDQKVMEDVQEDWGRRCRGGDERRGQLKQMLLPCHIEQNGRREGTRQRRGPWINERMGEDLSLGRGAGEGGAAGRGGGSARRGGPARGRPGGCGCRQPTSVAASALTLASKRREERAGRCHTFTPNEPTLAKQRTINQKIHVPLTCGPILWMNHRPAILGSLDVGGD